MPVDLSDNNPLAGSAWRQQFREVERLSWGNYGFVWLCYDVVNDNAPVAIKFISRSKDRIDKNVEREIINHSILDHPHIIQFKLCFLTDKYLAIAMEYAGSGHLLSHVNDRHGLLEDDARWLFQQLMLAVDYMHQMGVVNRDIKLENILLCDRGPFFHPVLKICDFGYSINENHSFARTALGTPGYTAPEVLGNVRNDEGYEGKPADVWSSGVVLYSMLFCRYPFDERPGDPPNNSIRNVQKQRQLFIERVQAGNVIIPSDRWVTPECEDLIRRIFQPDPMQRITIAEILEHPWFVINLPAAAKKGSWNEQVVRRDINHKARSEQIRLTVRAALQASMTPPPIFPSYEPRERSSDSMAGSDQTMSDLDASEGANY